MGFPGGASLLPANTGDAGSISGSGRSPGGGHGNPLQYSCLENSMDRGSWLVTVHRLAKNWTRLKQLSMHTHIVLSNKTWCANFVNKGSQMYRRKDKVKTSMLADLWIVTASKSLPLLYIFLCFPSLLQVISIALLLSRHTQKNFFEVVFNKKMFFEGKWLSSKRSW